MQRVSAFGNPRCNTTSKQISVYNQARKKDKDVPGAIEQRGGCQFIIRQKENNDISGVIQQGDRFHFIIRQKQRQRYLWCNTASRQISVYNQAKKDKDIPGAIEQGEGQTLQAHEINITMNCNESLHFISV